MTKTYKIPVVYSSWGVVEVEAIDIEEACELALKGPLPYDSYYLDGSFEIDFDSSILIDQLEQDDLELRQLYE